MLVILMMVVLVIWCAMGDIVTPSGLFLETGCGRTDVNASPEVLQVAKALERDAQRLLRHLEDTHAADPRTLLLKQTWNKQILPATDFANSKTKASFNKKTGCLYMRLNEPKTMAQWRAVMLHELAHVAGVGHDETYRRMWIFLLNVATKELGMDVALHCYTACNAYNVCGTACEMCTCHDST